MEEAKIARENKNERVNTLFKFQKHHHWVDVLTTDDTWLVSKEQTALMTGDCASVVELIWNGGMSCPSPTSASTFIRNPRKYFVTLYI